LKNGARTFEEVQKVTKCSTGCGTCEWKIREFINKKLDEMPEHKD
jgi:bacterioferritin-associated ferredoxin